MGGKLEEREMWPNTKSYCCCRLKTLRGELGELKMHEQEFLKQYRALKKVHQAVWD